MTKMQAPKTNTSINELVKDLNLQHIAIIMDGNRRWAKSKNLPSTTGHKIGVDSLKNIVESASDFGIKYLTVYAFSTENWNRKKEEVSFLMKLLFETIKNELDELNQNNVKINIIGDLSKLDNKLQEIINYATDKTSLNTGVSLQIAINYGSQNEILNAVKIIAQKVQNGEIEPEDISEKTIENNLYTKGIPNPDLLIRTGGEQRISNYLLWQIAYSEIIITEKYWPEFRKEDLIETIQEFSNRTRRFGAD